MAKVLVPIPQQDFDPTEVAVSWKVLSELGHTVRFATLTCRPASGDQLMASGEGLDPWGLVPGLRRLVVVGLTLRADRTGRAAFAEIPA